MAESEDRKDESAVGDEGWSGVAGAANESEANIIVGFLEEHGIPARVVDRSFHEIPTSGEDLTPIEVAVPAARVAEAQGVLEKRDAAFASSPEGSDTVLTDDGPTQIDPSADADGDKSVG